MFIGHYGVSLAAKRYNPTLSLAMLFLAVQFLDVFFSLFVLTGIEKMRIVHGFTAFNPYDLFFMPYSYSLLGALVWSAVFAIGFLGTLEPSRRRDCRGVGRLVCRRPDLPARHAAPQLGQRPSCPIPRAVAPSPSRLSPSTRCWRSPPAPSTAAGGRPQSKARKRSRVGPEHSPPV